MGGAEFAVRRDLLVDDDIEPPQSSLRVGRADDPAEARADHFAETVVAAMRAPLPTTNAAEQAGRIRRSSTSGSAADPAATPTRGRVRRAATHDALGGTAVDQSTAHAITSVSGGDPLPEPVRRAAQDASGLDLGAVRVHQGAASAELSSSLQATAFAVGSNIFLGGDAARPGTSAGNRLLAHEVGHVVAEGGHSADGHVRRLASGAALRAELGGPSTRSKTYREIIKALDAYESVLSWKPVADKDGLVKDAQTLDTFVKGVIDACTAFLSGHQKDKRAGRVATLKQEATRERAALAMRTVELKRGDKPAWSSWKEAIATTSETTTRDIKAEKGFSVGKTGGNMNQVEKLAFGVTIGERANRRTDAFFKEDKATAQGLEENYAEGIGIPRGDVHGATDADLSGPRFAQRAAASSRIDKLLNANVISKTEIAVRSTANGPVRGQLMEGAKGKAAAHYTADGPVDVDDPDLQRMLSKLDLVDSLCGQIDRHGGNFFIDRDATTGKVKAVTGIDNDMAFGTKGFTPGKTSEPTIQYAGIGKYIDNETGEAILRLTADDLHAVLDDLLLPNEVEATIERLVATQKIVQAAKDEGRLIGPERWGRDTTGEGGMLFGKKKATGYHADLFHERAL